MEANSRETAMRVSKITILGNIALSILKFTAGIAAHSSAMISDAVHSASDVCSTFVVMIGVKLASKAPDREHPYGHERMECAAALLLAAMLFATGLGIGAAGLRAAGSGEPPAVPGAVALAAAVVSIGVKEAMYWYTKAAGKKIHSSALMADAWHHRSDALSSVGSFLGILGARMGLPVLDPLSSVVICIFICKAAAVIGKDSLDKMMDKACDAATAGRIAEEILRQDGVLGIDQLNTRLFGDRIYVDVEIRADGSATLTETHQVAQLVHDAVESEFDVKHCMVHVNPG